VVLYAGNMGKKQGLDLLLDCAGLLAGEKSLVFLLFGDGVERERLAQRAAGMGNVRMYPFEEPAHLNELLNAADIHVLPQRKDAEGAVLPSKLGGILASGRPVIATASAASDVGRIVSKTGLLVAPGDVEALAQGIQRLANDANLRRALGAAGREYAVDNLNKEVILGKMADLLESHQARGIVC
jgi:colanic acid biosynthesis glycosyl transferase WcaI